MNNEIAVIIPTYNSEKTIKRTIDSVRNQHIENYAIKIIVADDCSTDSTKKIVQNLKHVVFVENEKHTGGPNTGRNTGIELSKDAKYIAFIDHDDEWLPGKLQNQVESLDKTGLNICYTGYRVLKDGQFLDFIYGHRSVVKYDKNMLFKLLLLRDMTKYILPYMSCYMLRNDNIPAFDHPIYDYGWSLRLLKGNEVVYSDNVYMLRHESVDNFSYDPEYLRGAIIYTDKILRKYKDIQAKIGRMNYNFDYYLKYRLEGKKKEAYKALWRTFV